MKKKKKISVQTIIEVMIRAVFFIIEGVKNLVSLARASF